MYLNNYSGSKITIQLSAKREIKPFSSLNLNDRDVEIIKEMIEQRGGQSKMFTETLRMSKFKIEDDSNFENIKKQFEETEAANAQSIQEKLEHSANMAAQDPKAAAVAKQSEIPTTPSEVEEVPPFEGTVPDEAQVEVDEVQQKRNEIAAQLKEEAAKEGKDWSVESLEAAIDEVMAEEAAKAIQEEAEVITEDPVEEGPTEEEISSEGQNEPVEELETLEAAVDRILANEEMNEADKTAALTVLASKNNIKLKNARSLHTIAKQIKGE